MSSTSDPVPLIANLQTALSCLQSGQPVSAHFLLGLALAGLGGSIKSESVRIRPKLAAMDDIRFLIFDEMIDKMFQHQG